MTTIDKIVLFVAFLLLAVVIGYAVRSSSQARLGIDGKGEA